MHDLPPYVQAREYLPVLALVHGEQHEVTSSAGAGIAPTSSGADMGNHLG